MSSLQKYFKWSLLFIICTHLIAAFFSEGFHRPDEHLGIFRMMSYKLGTFPLNELSWEYPTMIRPWLQPAAFYLVTKGLNIIGITNPFHLALVLRLLCSTIGIYSIYLLMRHSLKSTATNAIFKKIVFLSFALIWFIPFFHARTTAENLGISFMIFALYPLLKFSEKAKTYSWSLIPSYWVFFCGIMLGISFILRFQMGIMIFFFLLWSLFYAQIKFKKLFILLLGLIAVVGLSVFIDFWGYKQWTFSPWNYFYQNLILKKASGFGVSPWYYYLKKTFEKGYPPASLFMIIPTIWFVIKRPKHLFTWLVAPFFIIHSLIGHKELRFIFGLGLFVPFFIATFYDFLQNQKFNLKYVKTWKIIKILLIISLIENSAILTVSILKPAYTPISFYKHLYYKQEIITKIHTMRVFRDQLKFYLKNPIEQTIVEDKKKITNHINNSAGKVLWYQTNHMDDITFLEGQSKCKRDYLSYPDFIFKYKKYLKRSKVWALYRCQS